MLNESLSQKGMILQFIRILCDWVWCDSVITLLWICQLVCTVRSFTDTWQPLAATLPAGISRCVCRPPSGVTIVSASVFLGREIMTEAPQVTLLPPLSQSDLAWLDFGWHGTTSTRWKSLTTFILFSLTSAGWNQTDVAGPREYGLPKPFMQCYWLSFSTPAFYACILSWHTTS